MLRLILDSHPSIAVPSETGFMGGLLATKQIPNWNFGKDWYQRLGWGEPEFDDRLRDFYTGLFERYARDQGKPRWGEKTPFHTSHMAAMAQVFPEAVFVGIVRHPGAVAASLSKKFHYAFSDALVYWTATNLDMVRAAADLRSRFTLVRYEDLVEDGERTLRELVEFLGEPWSPRMLEHDRVQQEKGAPRAAEGNTITSQPIDPRRAVAWTASARQSEVDALATTADLAEFFGYDPIDPARRTGLDPGGQRLVPGSALAVRKSAWADRVDFASRPATPMVDAPAEELAARLVQVEQALARVRSRRAVRYVDALRKVQHGRSRDSLRAAWELVRRR